MALTKRRGHDERDPPLLELVQGQLRVLIQISLQREGERRKESDEKRKTKGKRKRRESKDNRVDEGQEERGRDKEA